MKFVQSFILLAACQIFNFASTYAKVLDKKVKYPNTDLYALVADQLNELESILGDKLSSRLVTLFKKYNIDNQAKYNSLLQTLSFIEEINGDGAVVPAKDGKTMSWGSRLKKTLKTAGKHLAKGNKYFKAALKAIIKVSMREFFIYMLPNLEVINEHSILSLRKEFRPAFARFVFNFYYRLFKKYNITPPKNFTREHFEEKFGMERDNIPALRDLIPIEN